ncbi:MAG: hypothetical protein JWR75_979 [Devosia sp.]|nr:hypothetical protein [Devosia sp.]
MLNPKDREAIEGLFFRLDDVERKSPPRDRDAEALIAGALRAQPAAPYYMAQTILVQEAALKLAEQKIAALEQRSGRVPQQEARRRGPWEQNAGADRGYGGGGFMAGAAQTAMGVAGGVLLGSAIASMFGAGAAQAGEWGGASESDADAAGAETDAPLDSGADDTDAGGDLGGGDDLGGGGDFDFGGDF